MTGGGPDVEDVTDVTRAVRAAAQRWLEATMSADAAALDGLVTADYTYTHATSARLDAREEWLESFRTGGRKYHVYAVADEVYRVYPDVVLLQGSAHQEMGDPDNRRELNTRFLSAWVNGGGAWKCAAWQATEIKQPQR